MDSATRLDLIELSESNLSQLANMGTTLVVSAEILRVEPVPVPQSNPRKQRLKAKTPKARIEGASISLPTRVNYLDAFAARPHGHNRIRLRLEELSQCGEINGRRRFVAAGVEQAVIGHDATLAVRRVSRLR